MKTETIRLSVEATEALEASGFERPLREFTGELGSVARETGVTLLVVDAMGGLLDVVEPPEEAAA